MNKNALDILWSYLTKRKQEAKISSPYSELEEINF